MDTIGKQIKERRQRLGLSRPMLAERIGVSVQTILNIEDDPAYNLGTTMLRRLEPELGVAFEIAIRRVTVSKSKITMGNDEFILYVRKRGGAAGAENAGLGRRILSEIMRLDPSARCVKEDAVSLWAQEESYSLNKLPMTASQFEFERKILPELFEFLDNL